MPTSQSYEVSVIIPTLNEQRYLSACLQSLSEQTFPHSLTEVMVIDGGSKDQTVAIAKDWTTRMPNLRVLHNPKHIQSTAFNIGVASSAAPYIIRLDAHSIYPPTYIAQLVSALRAHPEYGNVGGVFDIRPGADTYIAGAIAALTTSRFAMGGAGYRFQQKAGEVDTVPFGAFHRSTLKQVGGMREDLPRGEDNEFNARLRQAGKKVFLDPEIHINYFTRSTIPALSEQMYANGVSIGELIKIDRRTVGLRHIVPLLFTIVLLAAVLCSMTIVGRVILATVGGAYLIADIIAATITAARHGWRYLPLLIVLYPIAHLSYGCGTIFGLIHTK